MKPSLTFRVLLLPVIVVLAAVAVRDAEGVAVDGLEPVPSANVDTLYVAPGANLARYESLMLDPVEVVFKEGWETRNPDILRDDVTRIRSQAGAAFREIFGTELSMRGGYGLTTLAGPGVLRVSTKVSDLDVAKTLPEAGTVNYKYVATSADLVLTLELRDAVSGKLLARAIDRADGKAPDDFPIGESFEKSTAARRAVEYWAFQLRKALDEARAAPAPRG